MNRARIQSPIGFSFHWRRAVNITVPSIWLCSAFSMADWNEQVSLDKSHIQDFDLFKWDLLLPVSWCWRFLFLCLSCFHSREMCGWTSLIQAQTDLQIHRDILWSAYSMVCTSLSDQCGCASSLWAYVTEDQRQQPVFSSQCQPSLSLDDTEALYNTTDTMMTSLASVALSVFNIQTCIT